MFSQSTPIGLDRVGHRKLHRVLSGERSCEECSRDGSGRVWTLLRLFIFHESILFSADGLSKCSVTLDDSVSEEEDCSFDELADSTPYLQPGVELSVLNEVSDKTLKDAEFPAGGEFLLSLCLYVIPHGRPCEKLFSFFFFSRRVCCVRKTFGTVASSKAV